MEENVIRHILPYSGFWKAWWRPGIAHLDILPQNRHFDVIMAIFVVVPAIIKNHFVKSYKKFRKNVLKVENHKDFVWVHYIWLAPMIHGMHGSSKCRYVTDIIWPGRLLCRLDDLTHWGRVTHICVGKLVIIGSDNGLSPDRRQAIISTNAGLLSI